MKFYKINRTLSKEVYPWLNNDVEEGTVVQRFKKCTYGCIGDGVAVTRNPDGDYPFFEVPADCLETVFL